MRQCLNTFVKRQTLYVTIELVREKLRCLHKIDSNWLKCNLKHGKDENYNFSKLRSHFVDYFLSVFFDLHDILTFVGISTSLYIQKKEG